MRLAILCPLTLPLSTLRAADNSDCGITPFSAPKVFTTDDTADGIDNPCEFSARTKNMYDVAGLSSPICKDKIVTENSILKWKIKVVVCSFWFFFCLLSAFLFACIHIVPFYTFHKAIVYSRDGIKCKINKLCKCLASRLFTSPPCRM